LTKNTKACRRPSLFVTVFLLSITLLAFVPVGSYQKGFAVLLHAQARASTSTKPKAKNRKPRADQWYVFKSPDSDFTLQFPRKPDVQDVSEGPITLIRYYDVTTVDGTTFSINFHDIGGDPHARENNEWSRDLEQTVSDADRAQNRQIVQTHRIGKNIVEAEILQTENSGVRLNYLRRSILRGGRVFTLGCGPAISNKKVDRPLCERYFNSMRFITQPPKHAKRR